MSEEQRPLYTQRVDEMSPSIRYCAYNIGDLPSDVKELQKLKSTAAGSDILASKIDVSCPVFKSQLHCISLACST